MLRNYNQFAVQKDNYQTEFFHVLITLTKKKQVQQCLIDFKAISS